MEKNESMEFFRSLVGEKNFKPRTDAEKAQAFRELAKLFAFIEGVMPSAYTNIYGRFNLFEPVYKSIEKSQEFRAFWAYNGGKYGFQHLFEYFYTADEVIDDRKSPAEDEEENLLKWGFLKIGRTPWSDCGIYIGMNPENNGKIYWIMLGWIMDGFDPNNLRESDKDAFRLVADDMHEFIAGLFFYFPEIDLFEIRH
jgi:hypothetical protein